MIAVVSLITTFLVSLLVPYALAPRLQRMGVIDIPNWRSAHTSTTIRGVGLAPLFAMMAGYFIILADPQQVIEVGTLVTIAVVSAAAGVIGWVEDSRGLSVAVRASFQIALGLAATAAIVIIEGGPWPLIPLFAGYIAGYINVANFMDGINGISSFHGLVVGASYAAFGLLLGFEWMAAAGAILGVAFIAFLPWNLSGKMFLGDVGSYLLGGGVSVIGVASVFAGAPVVLVLSPVVIYLADSGVTLVTRVIRGERWQDAHRSHVYQRLTDMGLSHICVTLTVTAMTCLTSLAGALIIVEPGLWAVTVALLAFLSIVYLLFPRIVSAARSGRLRESAV